jgi:hypothetical protein
VAGANITDFEMLGALLKGEEVTAVVFKDCIAVLEGPLKLTDLPPLWPHRLQAAARISGGGAPAARRQRGGERRELWTKWS